MSYRLRLDIPELPIITSNARMHQMVVHKDRVHWDRVIALMTAGKRPIAPLERAKLTLIRHSSKCPDWDNLAISFKHPVDALVSAGVLKDDKREVIGMPDFKWEKAPPKCGRIEMIVEEVVS